MKQIRFLVTTTLIVFLATSCHDEVNNDFGTSTPPKGTFTLTVSGAETSANTRAGGTELGNTHECNASRIELFYFDREGADARCIASQTVLPESGATAIAFPLSVRMPDNIITLQGKVWVRGVTSITTGLADEADLSKITHARIDALTYNGVASQTDGGTPAKPLLFYPDGSKLFIPMTGIGAIFPDGLGNKLELQRIIAKIRLRIDETTLPTACGITLDATTMSVRMLNLPSQQTIGPAGGQKTTYTLVDTPFAGKDGIALHPENSNTTPSVAYQHSAYTHETYGKHPSQTTPAAIEVQLPYTFNTDGKRVENNYYRFNLPENLDRNTLYNVTLHVKGFGSETDAFTVTIDVEEWGVENKQVEAGKIHVESKYEHCMTFLKVGDVFTATELTPDVDIKVAAPTNYTLIEPTNGIVRAGVKTPIVLRVDKLDGADSGSFILTDAQGNISIPSPVTISSFTTTNLSPGYCFVDFPGIGTYHCDRWQDAEFTYKDGSAYTRATAVTDINTDNGTRCHFNGNLTDKTKIIEISCVESGMKVGRFYSQPPRIGELFSKQSDADGSYLSSRSPIDLGYYFNTMAYNVAMNVTSGIASTVKLTGNVLTQEDEIVVVGTNDFESSVKSIAADKQRTVRLSFAPRDGVTLPDVTKTLLLNRTLINGVVFMDRNMYATSPQHQGAYLGLAANSPNGTVNACPAGYDSPSAALWSNWEKTVNNNPNFRFDNVGTRYHASYNEIELLERTTGNRVYFMMAGQYTLHTQFGSDGTNWKLIQTNEVCYFRAQSPLANDLDVYPKGGVLGIYLGTPTSEPIYWYTKISLPVRCIKNK